MPYAVTEDHVLVPHGERGTLAVLFDDAYVWSFTTPRDGSWHPRGRRIRWPDALRRRLDGTAVVRLESDAGRRFESPISFGASPDPLQLRDKNGHPLAIDSAGHLIRVFSETDETIRQQILEGTRLALEHLRADGYDAHLSYGCLLGAVRDGHMIGHDSDADLAYLSPYTTPAQVIGESYAMERALRRRGWKLVRMSGADLKLLHPLADGRTVQIDIFGAFYVGDTFYQLGGRSGSVPRSALTPASTVVLEGVELAAPADPEAVLAFLYGESWRVPDPAFQSDEPQCGQRRIEGWVRGVRTDVVAWNEFFRDRGPRLIRTPSNFSRWAAERLGPGAAVVDLGCGNGRDAVWFKQDGRPTLAYDISSAAIRRTRLRFAEAGAPATDVRALALNDRRSVLVAGAELARTPQPANLYARQLIGCLDDEARDLLYLLASMSLRRGGSLLLEFSTGRGPEPDPWETISRIDVDTVVGEITARGGIVDEVLVEPGLDFLDRPDPRIARIVAHWATPSAAADLSTTDRKATG